jgi:hypothetical protein
MKIFLLILFTLFSLISGAQEKGDNTIIVKGVGFDQVCQMLLDKGFVIEKKDSDLQTVKTEFKTGTGKNKWMKHLMNIRVKDSIATITGQWYNTMFLGSNLGGQQQTIETLVDETKYTSGNPRACFNEVKEFALAFGKPVEYRKQ